MINVPTQWLVRSALLRDCYRCMLLVIIQQTVDDAWVCPQLLGWQYFTHFIVVAFACCSVVVQPICDMGLDSLLENPKLHRFIFVCVIEFLFRFVEDAKPD